MTPRAARAVRRRPLRSLPPQHLGQVPAVRTGAAGAVRRPAGLRPARHGPAPAAAAARPHHRRRGGRTAHRHVTQ